MQALKQLLDQSAKDLELMISDFSSSAVLGFLVRILANPDLIHSDQGNSSGPILVQRFFCNAFGWADYTDSDFGVSVVRTLTTGRLSNKNPEAKLVTVPGNVESTFYAMAGDRAGSYFLEALIECGSIHFVIALVAGAVLGKVREYTDDGSGNFVIQAILRRLSCELERVKKGAGQINRASNNIAEVGGAINAVAAALLNELLAEEEYFRNLLAHKGGVVLWLLELSRWHSNAEWAEKLGMSVINYWVATYAQPEDPDAPIEKQLSVALSSMLIESKQSVAAAAASARNASSKGKKPFTGNNDQQQTGAPAHQERDSTQLLFARLLGALLRCPSSSVRTTAAKAFSQAAPDCLRYVATSGPASRTVIDVFFEEFPQSVELKVLISNLASVGSVGSTSTSASTLEREGGGRQSQPVHLAAHYVGQHIVRKAYEAADVRGKEKWAMLLCGEREVLQRSKEGRGSLQLVNAELYQRDPTEWRSAAKRKAKAQSMLSELVAGPSTSASAQQQLQQQNNIGKSASAGLSSTHGPQQDGAGEMATISSGDGAPSGRKRKRKHHNTAAAGEDSLCGVAGAEAVSEASGSSAQPGRKDGKKDSGDDDGDGDGDGGEDIGAAAGAGGAGKAPRKRKRKRPQRPGTAAEGSTEEAP